MAVHEMKIENVSKNFRRKKVLREVTCNLQSGTYGLLGPNGAGKTTLMRCITNFYSHQGKIMIDGKGAKKLSSAEIGYLPQKFEGYPALTVRQMLEYFCNLKKIPNKERQNRI
ncbi:MAG: ATP-binding cassette domain-containing protein, partial [Lachnospiraceae bacterium]|nr:ATP-binding cassette domain-containing protein [Lachnospiraceae bacterium]